jgi:NAD(P)H-dependent FMN reductase
MMSEAPSDRQHGDRRKTVLLIMGSTRAGRICPRIATWIQQIGLACTDLAYEVVDLADWPLPMDDEPGIPALGVYSQPHTRAWSDKIKAADAVAFVTPQFNWGYPAALKNAIDHLFSEWQDKPAMIVTYGGHGGSRCAKQLRRVAAAVKMRVAVTTPAITLPLGVILQTAQLDLDEDCRSYVPRVKKAFWQLAAQLDGTESFLARLYRQWRTLTAALL